MVKRWVKDVEQMLISECPTGDYATFTHGKCLHCGKIFKLHKAKPSHSKCTDCFRINFCDKCRPAVIEKDFADSEHRKIVEIGYLGKEGQKLCEKLKKAETQEEHIQLMKLASKLVSGTRKPRKR